jgi:hypothetical protein
MGRCLSVARNRSLTSRGMKHGMGRGTSGMRDMHLRTNTTRVLPGMGRRVAGQAADGLGNGISPMEDRAPIS